MVLSKRGEKIKEVIDCLKDLNLGYAVHDDKDQFVRISGSRVCIYVGEAKLDIYVEASIKRTVDNLFDLQDWMIERFHQVRKS